MIQETLTLAPIGVIRTPFHAKYDAPHQPEKSTEPIQATIILNANQNFEQALEDLDGIEKIWLLYWFDRNANWKPKVQVPRGERKKRGLFATRSPHRPNPIGLTLVDLISVSGLKLTVGNVDLLDGTPILDIKPYLPHLESHPNARAGWIEEAEDRDLNPLFSVTYSPLALAQLAMLEEHGIRFRNHVERVLRRDPAPHPYRRIERRSATELVLAVKAWRIIFGLENNQVVIDRIVSGYTKEMLLNTADQDVSDAAAQRAFQLLWPQT